MRSWMRSSTAKRTAWILMAAFVWTAVGPQPARAAVEYCKELRAAALPQARELTDSEMGKIAGGRDKGPPPCTDPCGCISNASAAGSGDGSGDGSGGSGGGGGAFVGSVGHTGSLGGGYGCPSCGQGSASSVNPRNGNLATGMTVMNVQSGRGSTSLRVFYNNQAANDGPLGRGWSHSYMMTLTGDPPEKQAAAIRVDTPNGGKLYFSADDPDWRTDLSASFTPIYDGGAPIYSVLQKYSPDLQISGYYLWAKDSVSAREYGGTYHCFPDLVSGESKLEYIYIGNGFGSGNDWTTTLEYCASGVSAVGDRTGNKATFVYITGTNRINYVQYPGDVRATFTYALNNGAYDLVSIERPIASGQQGSVTTYTYDSTHRVTSIATGSGTTSYLYESGSDRLQTVIDPLGYRTTYEYTPSDPSVAAETVVRTDPSGAKTTTENIPAGANTRVRDIIDAAGNRTTYAYDAAYSPNNSW